MKREVFVVALAVAGAFMASSETFAQADERPFSVIEEVYVVPGMGPEFEAAAKARTLRMAAGNLSFTQYAGGSENGFYRFLTQLANDLASLDRWREEIAGMPPAATPVSGVEIIQRIDRSVWQFRSEVSRVNPPDAQPRHGWNWRQADRPCSGVLTQTQRAILRLS